MRIVASMRRRDASLARPRRHLPDECLSRISRGWRVAPRWPRARGRGLAGRRRRRFAAETLGSRGGAAGRRRRRVRRSGTRSELRLGRATVLRLGPQIREIAAQLSPTCTVATSEAAPSGRTNRQYAVKGGRVPSSEGVVVNVGASGSRGKNTERSPTVTCSSVPVDDATWNSTPAKPQPGLG